MIVEFAFEWYFWVGLISLAAVGSWLISARLLDFPFFVVLVLGQYVLHTGIAFGLAHSLTAFSILFFIILLACAGRPGAVGNAAPRPLVGIESDWIVVAKAYLLLYYAARLAFYPFMGGELLLDERLVAQQDNPLIFTLGLAVQPALAACIYSWIALGKRLSGLDVLIILLVLLGLLGSGSKGGVITLILTYLGVASYLGQKVLRSKWVVLAGVAIIGLTLYVLTRLFPDVELSSIGMLIIYRLAANTDSVEYLVLGDINPQAYPFAGIGALFPMIFKRLGYVFEYPPGVWLYGMRFDDWSGFGPNPGILMDYFGNLGWFGLLAAVGIGLYVRKARRRISVVGCSFLAMALMLVVDVGIFNVGIIVWGSVYILLKLKHRIFARSGSHAVRSRSLGDAA